MTTIHINRMFLEAIEIALSGQARRLAKDIAAALGKPEEPLLKLIETDKMHLRVFEEGFDEDIEDIRCKYHIPFSADSKFLVCCNEPVVWVSAPWAPKDRCIHHVACKQPAKSLPVITLMHADDAQYFVDMEALFVYNEVGDIVGKYGPDENEITLFEEAAVA